jgi:hypothetical protein
VVAFSSNPALLAEPVAVSYFSAATNGTLTLVPLTNAHGTALVSVVVRDDAAVVGGGFNAVTNTFLVTVTPVNDRPSLAAVSNQVAFEGVPFLLTNMAADVDLPDDVLTFVLATAPTNAVIDPVTGTVTWTPTELHGGTTNQFAVVVADSGTPSLKATNQFTVTVIEVNSPPALAPLADRMVHVGTVVTVSATASDTDLPANELTYSLGAGFPAGASINASNGLFNWTTAAVVTPATNTITVIATDNGLPPLADSRSFRLIVVERPHIESISVEGTNVALTWTAVPGVQYGVQFKPSLQLTNWSDLPGSVFATNFAAEMHDTRQPVQRFYQIRVLP